MQLIPTLKPHVIDGFGADPIYWPISAPNLMLIFKQFMG